MKFRVIALSLLYICSQAASASAASAKNVTDPVTGMEFVLVKGGCFQMGSGVKDDEKPVHEVCVKDFYLGKQEVTQAQWLKVTGVNPSSFKQCGPSCPVETVSWNDAQEFIKALSSKSKKKYRLPTEAEWEFAARSASKGESWAGTGDEAALTEYAWFDKNSGDGPHKTGQLKPNSLGLYDMSGNVWEWCQDRYSDKFYAESKKVNPSGPEDGSFRAARGGSFGNDAGSLRSANRDNLTPDTRNANLGLRLVRVP